MILIERIVGLLSADSDMRDAFSVQLLAEERGH